MDRKFISDEKQADTKERGHMGADKHERLFFSMSPTGSGTPESVEEVVSRLVLKQQHRGPGSFAASVQDGYSVKVTVLWSPGSFSWDVRKGGKVTDRGIALLLAGGKVEISKGQDVQPHV